MFSNQVDESTANGGGNENVLVASGRLFRNLALSVAASFEEAGFFGHQWCAHRFRWPGIFPSLSVSCLTTRRGGVCALSPQDWWASRTSHDRSLFLRPSLPQYRTSSYM